MDLVLASASPRRRELLTRLGLGDPAFGFEILAADIDEGHNGAERPDALVVRLAIEKAQAGLALWAKPDARVIGADTLVVLQGEILGKPRDKADAARMLRALSGGWHTVMTAVAVTDGRQTLSRLVETKVCFSSLTEQDIQAYIASGEPMDKAGAYGIQGLGGCFVAAIEGSYSAVVGLPLVETRALLRTMRVL